MSPTTSLLTSLSSSEFTRVTLVLAIVVLVLIGLGVLLLIVRIVYSLSNWKELARNAHSSSRRPDRLRRELLDQVEKGREAMAECDQLPDFGPRKVPMSAQDSVDVRTNSSDEAFRESDFGSEDVGL